MLDEHGVPTSFEHRERKESHRLIEECMLAANEAVAKFCLDRRLPTIYRHHGEPDEEKIAVFSALARAHGFQLPLTGKVSSKELNEFLGLLEDHPEQVALNQLLLRSMMQAVYSGGGRPLRNFAAHCLHFTSPIRRYRTSWLIGCCGRTGGGRRERERGGQLRRLKTAQARARGGAGGQECWPLYSVDDEGTGWRGVPGEGGVSGGCRFLRQARGTNGRGPGARGDAGAEFQARKVVELAGLPGDWPKGAGGAGPHGAAHLGQLEAEAAGLRGGAL